MDQIIIDEIIHKEEEKYCLKSIGLVYDADEICRRLYTITASPEVEGLGFSALRELVVHHLYVHVLKYAAFVDRNKGRNPRLEYRCAVLSKRYIAALASRRKGQLDAELKTGDSLTVAYHPADTIIRRLHQRFIDSDLRFENPDEVRAFYHRNIETIYPIVLSGYIDYLELGDRSFWELTCRYIKELVNVAVVCNLAGLRSCSFRMS